MESGLPDYWHIYIFHACVIKTVEMTAGKFWLGNLNFVVKVCIILSEFSDQQTKNCQK